MNKYIILFLILLILIIGIFLCKNFANRISEIKIITKEKTIPLKVELAKTQAQRQQGLTGREELAENAGMLFIFNDEAPRSFWMKNMLMPIDIIFIAQDKKIISIQQSVPPCQSELCPSYKSKAPARYVLEVGAGFCEKQGISVGDGVE